MLDEATSALDSTENEFASRLQSWSKGKTVFFITHRLSTIRNSDLIVLMEKGRIAEKGTHSELMFSMVSILHSIISKDMSPDYMPDHLSNNSELSPN